MEQNRTNRAESDKEYRVKHSAERAAYNKTWLETNPNYMAEYYQRNKEKLLARSQGNRTAVATAEGRELRPKCATGPKTFAAKPLIREELAWAAGFADGEGSFFSCNNGKTAGRQPVFSISQVDQRALIRFYNAVGFGSVTDPYQPPSRAKGNSRPICRYRVSGFNRVQAIMALLWTWLGPVKREQAKSILTQYTNERG